ncbi:MAG: hypothetical protein JO352_35890 [Chloroflexi bacterium]|nr:hypothetical protein [Chloroflexota bacterium]MBV9598830.1 hypothetical protein [Chloroflexota bacterium]
MACVAHLLPNFDEYMVACRDRSALHPDALLESTLFSFGNILSNVVVVNGVARGALTNWSPRSGMRSKTPPGTWNASWSELP